MRTINLNNIPTLFTSIKEESIEDGDFSKREFAKNLKEIVNENGFYINYDNFIIFSFFEHTSDVKVKEMYFVINALKYTDEENLKKMIDEFENYALDYVKKYNGIKYIEIKVSNLELSFCARTEERIEDFKNFNYKEHFYDRGAKDKPTYMRKSIEIGD